MQEQVRDLMFYIEAQKQLSAQKEVQDGQVVLVPSPVEDEKSPSKPRPKKKKRGKQ